MTSELSTYAARLREHIAIWSEELSTPLVCTDRSLHDDIEFKALALMLFTLQYHHNDAYQKLCRARGIAPDDVNDWTQIPPVPAAAFKELDMTCLPPDERSRVFHSSGTTEQRPSRHFHNAISLGLYEASLWSWLKLSSRFADDDLRLISLTPSADQTPHSSLVHMFDFVAKQIGGGQCRFVGRVASDGSWELDLKAALFELDRTDSRKLLLVGTAFGFVHLLDEMVKRDIRIELPHGTRVLETGGYKGRSRSMPKKDLHALIVDRLGVSHSAIICEYGMSELSSQAYQHNPEPGVADPQSKGVFSFPPWARARVISPETGKEVRDGETGLLSIVDLANVFSVAAIQTEDLAIRRGAGFELLGRADRAEPRGCSLTSA